MDKALTSIYYNPSHPASFGGLEKLWAALKIKSDKYSKEDVEIWLTKQDAYTLNRKVVRRFMRRPVIAYHVDSIWQMDLADVSNMSSFNDKINFLLIAVDVLSRHAWVQPIHRKTGFNVMMALEKIFNTGRKPMFINTDQGKEFLNAEVQNFFKTNNIKHYTTTGDDPKCAIAERFIRTLREKMNKFMVHSNHRRYIDHLQNFVDSYNNAVHSRLKMKPVDVSSDNCNVAFQTLYGKYARGKKLLNKINPNKKNQKIKVGDMVRIARKKNTFDKASETTTFTRELFKVKSISRNNPLAGKMHTTYKLQDLMGEDITSIHYPQEIVRVTPRDEWAVEKVLKTKTVNGQVMEFVKWLGYPNKFNSWIQGD
jgi:Integrase core domain